MSENHDLDGPVEKFFCSTKVEVIKISCEWKICNFSVISLDTGSMMKSPNFSPSNNSDIKCHIGLYPQGRDAESKEYLAIFLFLRSQHNTIKLKANLEFSILNKYRKKCFVFQSVKIFNKGEGHGAHKYVLRSKIINPTYLVNDCLIIVCDIIIGLNGTNLEGCTMVHNTITNEKCQLQLLNNYESFLKDQHLSDVTIFISNKRLKAHKTILAAHSPVFLAMFKNDTKENHENTIVITDIDLKVFQELLRFIYSGKIEDMDAIVMDLLVAADKYSIDGLMMKCEQYLQNSLNPDNVIDILVLADNHNADNLRQSAIKLYAADKKKVMNELDILDQLKPNTVKDILKLTMQ